MKNIHKQKLLLIIVSAIGVLSVFFPWLIEGNKTTLGISTGFGAYLAIICLAGTIVVCTYGDTHLPLVGIHQYLAAGFSAVAAIVGILNVISVIGIGLLLLQICGIVGIVLALNISRKKEDDFKQIN